MKPEVGEMYYYNTYHNYPNTYIIYKVISTNKNENITIYNCEIISSNNQYYLLEKTFIMKEGYSYIAENSKQLTDELKVELL